MSLADKTRERVLLLAPAGRDAPLAHAILGKAGITASVCANLAGLCDDLSEGAAAAVISEEAFLEWDARCLIDWIAAQEPWSDLPVITLLDKAAGREERHDIIFLKTAANITILERPTSASALVSTVRSALRARKRQYEVKDSLEALAQSEKRYRVLADDLERLVVTRTQSLAQANERLLQEISERERAEDALRQAQKLESIGQLTTGLAHDFNNLLQAILGNIEIAHCGTKDPTARRSLDSATRAAERGAKLTSQLLAFSRKQLLAPRAIDLNAVVSNASDMLLRTMGTSILIDTAVDPDAWPALIDPTQIELVLLNLALNSRDAMPNGGRLTLATANVRSADRPATLPEGDYIVISVADTGTGMSEGVRTKAFEPFFTTKEIGRGSGLGLSMVHGVATQSGGTVEIESRLGEGTTVRVYLPRSPSLPVVRLPSSPPTIRARSSATILVVDDDQAVRDVAVASLRSLGYKTVEAQDGYAALTLLERLDRVDLFLVDVAMPGLNGIEFVRRARECLSVVRVLFVTGHAAAYHADFLGGEMLLEKPYSINRLAEAVTNALERDPSGADHNVVKLKPLSER